MREVYLKIKSNKLSVYPIGDMHIGDKGFGQVSRGILTRVLEEIKKNPDAKIIFMGDIVNTATRDSKSSPFSQNMDLNEQVDEAVKLFMPVKDKIIGAIEGNHENRLLDFAGYTPTVNICARLGVPYFADSVAITFNLKESNSKKSGGTRNFKAYFHHTTGGGNTVGGRMNRVAMLKGIIPNADFYCGGHNHMLGATSDVVHMINDKGGIDILKQKLIDCGGFLQWNNSYAERQMLRPLQMGCQRIDLFFRNVWDNEKGWSVREKEIQVTTKT